MRSSVFVALFAALALLMTTQASALSSVAFVYLGGAAGEDTCTPGATDCDIVVAVGDTLSFAVVVNVDTEGMAAYSFDLRWDEDGNDYLDSVTARERGALSFTGIMDPGPPPTTTSIGYTVSQSYEMIESSEGSGGHIYGYQVIGQSPTPPYISSVSFRVAYVKFEVTDNLVAGEFSEDETATFIEMGFFTGFAGGNTFGLANFEAITPNFGSIRVGLTLPEPNLTLSIAASFAALGLLARRSRRTR